MMLNLIFVLLGTFRGIQGNLEECDISPFQKCVHHIPKEEIAKISVVPDEEELKLICPGHINYFKCFNDHMDDCGAMGEHHSVVQFITEVTDIVEELCNENSQLHRAYVANVDCYKTLRSSGADCDKTSYDKYKAYREFARTQPGESDSADKSSQRMCMMESYKIGCISDDIMKSCGESAIDTYLEVVHRSKYLRQFCSQSSIDDLRTEFLNFIDVNEKQKIIFSRAFDFKK